MSARLDELRKRWPMIASREAYMAYLRKERMLTFMRECSLETCAGCIHHDAPALWCTLQDLPASFNPILTPATGMVGMACMGAGREDVNADQTDLFDRKENDLPW